MTDSPYGGLREAVHNNKKQYLFTPQILLFCAFSAGTSRQGFCSWIPQAFEKLAKTFIRSFRKRK